MTSASQTPARETAPTYIAAFGDDHHVVLFYCPRTPVTSLLVFDRFSYAPSQAQ